jgi:peroxiredoxin
MKLLLTLACIIIILSCNNRKQVVATGHEGKPMPSFNLLLMDSTTTINTKSIPAKKPVVLLFISPRCPYCKIQTEDIIENIKTISNAQVYILTSLPFPMLKQFYDQFNLKKYPDIVVGYDYNAFFPQYFKVSSIPYIAIYNENKLLKEVLVGKVSTGLIKDIITN